MGICILTRGTGARHALAVPHPPPSSSPSSSAEPRQVSLPRTGKLSRWGDVHQMGFRNLPHLWSAGTLAQENRFWGWVPGVPRASVLGSLGGSQLIPCGGRCGGSRPLGWGGGLDVPRKLQDPWYLRLQHGAASVSAPPPQVTPAGHTDHREKRTGAGGGQGKREAGSPHRPTGTQGNICRWRCLAERRLWESQDASEAPCVLTARGAGPWRIPVRTLRPRPLPAEQPAAGRPSEKDSAGSLRIAEVGAVGVGRGE